MPKGQGSFKLRKVPKKDLFWVVSKETGKKHSKEGLPKDRAKAQMRALYAAESGAVMRGSGPSQSKPISKDDVLAEMIALRKQLNQKKKLIKDFEALIEATRIHNSTDMKDPQDATRNREAFRTMERVFNEYAIPNSSSGFQALRKRVDDARTEVIRLNQAIRELKKMSKDSAGLVEDWSGKALPTMNTSTLSTIARMGYKTGSELLTNVNGWELYNQTPNLRFYKKDGEMIVSVRGSKTLSDWTDSNTKLFRNKLREGKRYKEDRAEIEKMRQFATNMYGVGHSLGGALLDEFIKDGLVLEAVSFNPAVQPENWDNAELAQKNKRLYYPGDPVYEIMGKYTVGAEVAKASPEDWIVEYAIRFPDFKKVTSIPSAVKELMKTRISLPSAVVSGFAHQVSRFLPMEGDVKMMEDLKKGIEAFRSEGMKGGRRMRGGAELSGMPTSWSWEQWGYFLKYVDAVVFDKLSDDSAKAVVSAVLTAIGLLPQFNAALAAGLTFWEAAVALAPLVTSASATAGLSISLPFGMGVVSVAAAIAIFWALVYAHEYLYPACNKELVSAGKPCNELRTKRISEDLYKDVMKLKGEYEAREKERADMAKGKGIKELADKVLRKEAKESGKKSEPSREEYRAVLAEEALRFLQKKFRKVPFIPPPPPLLRRRESGRGMRGGRTDPDRPSLPPSPPPSPVPPPPEFEEEENPFPDVTSFESVYGFLAYMDGVLEEQGLELSDMTPAFDELMDILLNYEEEIPEEDGEEITFLLQQIYAVAEPYLQTGAGMRGGALPEFPEVSPPGSAAEKRAYFRQVRDWLLNIYANHLRPALVRKLQLEASSPGSMEIMDLEEELQSIKARVEEFRTTEYYGTPAEWTFVFGEALVKAGLAERD